MMVLCNYASVIVKYDGRRSGLPNAPVVIEYDDNRTEQSTAIALSIQHNPCTPIHTYYIFTNLEW